jgi:quinol monooxygenase YgiN
MVIITGTITASEATIDEALARSLEHVKRSREEPGCLAHGVSRDVENPLRLVFVEQWADMADVLRHFRVPEVVAFAKAVGELAAAPPTLELFEATPTSPRDGS